MILTNKVNAEEDGGEEAVMSGNFTFKDEVIFRRTTPTFFPPLLSAPFADDESDSYLLISNLLLFFLNFTFLFWFPTPSSTLIFNL